jgi:hypothetical protein
MANMKIEQLEEHFENKLSNPLKDLLREFSFSVPKHGRLRVSLIQGNGRKKRSDAAAESWSPESDRLQIWFEPAKGRFVPEEAAKSAEGLTQPAKSEQSKVFRANPSSDPISDLVAALDRAESRPGWDFVALKKFRDEALVSEGFRWSVSDTSRQEVLRDAIESRFVLVSKVPNPKSPQFPVTAIRLNRLMPEVQRILGRQPNLDSDFAPVEIRGEGLSATILRERR